MKEKIIEVNCDISELEELAGYTIQEVIGCCDSSGEGFSIKAYRKISGVRVYRDFRKERRRVLYKRAVHSGMREKENCFADEHGCVERTVICG